MWIYTHYTMALRNRHPEEISGAYRAVLESTAAMQTEIDIEGTDPSMLSEKQLRERINREIRGDTISYTYSNSTLKSHSIREGLKAWFKIGKWWFLAMLCTSTLCLTTWRFLGWFWRWLWSIWFGQFWAF
jgi:hypothetical protein